MSTLSTPPPLATRKEDDVMMEDLISEPPKKEFSAIAIVKIPLLFTEEKVRVLMGSMEAQFEGTGHKVIFIPEEVDVSVMGCTPPPTSSKKNSRQR